MTDQEGDLHTMLVMSKACLVPIKPMSIPRLELAAAVLAAKIDSTLRKQMSVPLEESYLWSDSEIVLSYIYNQENDFMSLWQTGLKSYINLLLQTNGSI